ncbi:efflux RND transporter permease subunit [Symmachiella dynata]|uniref:efflux RND transporter permease subunit n=1 Tax=Symmachiella dynata TaxID=2527995 RepID=UPI0030EC359C
MSIPSFSVKNPVLVNMIMIVVLVAGGIFSITLTREMFPESRPNKLLISTLHPGVQPEEIERAITIKVEEAVRDIDGVEKVESTVSESLSMTSVTLYSQVKDVDRVLQEVKVEVDAIQDLPDDAEKTVVRKMEPKLPVISVAIFGDGGEKILKREARKIRDDLLLLPGVSDVEVSGTRDDEISVEIRPERLRQYDITFDEVADAIRQTNRDVSGGELESNRTLMTLRTLGEEREGEDLLDIVVRSTPDGRKILLSDVAVVIDEFIESDLECYFNGKPSASCIVFKTADQDAIQIARMVKAYVAGKERDPDFDPYGFRKAYNEVWYWKPLALVGSSLEWFMDRAMGRPDLQEVYETSASEPIDGNFQLGLHSDLARFVEGRLDLMTRNGKSGLFLVLLSLVLFLNWRVAFWAAIGLPISFMGTFIMMWAFGETLNLISMMGLIVVLGIIVDDAIVIGENIYRHVEEGMPPRQAAIVGAEEVMWPVTVAILTTIGAFAPLLFITGQIGDFMGVLPMVVLCALSVSLCEALVILPAHLSHIPPHRSDAEKGDQQQVGRIRRFFHWLGAVQEKTIMRAINATYERLLRFTLRWRYVTLTVALALVIASFGLIAGGIVEIVMVQEMDSETIIAGVEMPVGTPAATTKKRLNELTQYAVSLPEVVNVQSFVALQIDFTGAGAVGDFSQPHLAQLIIELQPAELRNRSSDQILDELRGVSEKLSGVNSVTWEAMSGGPGGKDIELRIAGDDFEELKVVSGKLKAQLATYKGVYGLDDNHDRGKREVRVEMRDAGRPTGIQETLLGSHVRSAFYGREVRRITRDREDVKIMVRYPKSFRYNIYNLESMWIPTPATTGNRGWVPVNEVARLTEGESFTSIHRSQQTRSITVIGQINDEQGNSRDIMADVRRWFSTELRKEHPQVRLEELGKGEEFRKAMGSLWIGGLVSLLLIYMMLAGLFRAYLQPIVVMAAIPFGVLGAIIGHWVTGNPLTILSFIGCVALTGIVVNDSLVLVDFINRRVKLGMTPFEANVAGAKLRLRAILLTTLTTVAGLMPLMFETSFQAKFLIPLAVTLTFGLAFATGLTLVIVPSLNMVYMDLTQIVGRRKPDDPEENDDQLTGELATASLDKVL